MFAAKKSSAAEAGLIDSAVLDGLRKIFGDRTATLLSRTRQMVTERIATIEGMAQREPDAAMARVAHEIGGMAGQVGMARLSREALALERLCLSDKAAATPAARELVALARDSLAALPRG